MMSNNMARNMFEQLRNNAIINFLTQLRRFGHFYKICIMMHGSINVKLIVVVK
jgi:hypothetical protein